MDERTIVIATVCDVLAPDRADAAVDALRSSYPFTRTLATTRRYGPAKGTRVFIRDGFDDRYTGSRVVFPPVHRAISVALPEDFPYHSNWKMDVAHPAYWELTATIDHLVPACRGRADDASNWVTTSMARNSAKDNWALKDPGWSFHPPGDMLDWDGLLGWYVDYTAAHPDVLLDNSMKQWLRAALATLTYAENGSKNHYCVISVTSYRGRHA